MASSTIECYLQYGWKYQYPIRPTFDFEGECNFNCTFMKWVIDNGISNKSTDEFMCISIFDMFHLAAEDTKFRELRGWSSILQFENIVYGYL